MILILQAHALHEEVEYLRQRLQWMGLRSALRHQDGRPTLAIVDGMNDSVDMKAFETLPLVDKVIPFTREFKLAGLDLPQERLTVTVGNVIIGGDKIVVMAGPCSVESELQMMKCAEIVASSGGTILRGGAFKPRTSPYSFQGLGEEGLRLLAAAGKKFGLPVISEVMDTEDIELVAKYVDIVQVGARNMQNFSLLKKLGRIDTPVMLKRGSSATYKDLLMASEYILDGGNTDVILCERGIRTFESYTRNTLDLAAIPSLKSLSRLPVIADPSHGTGVRDFVAPMARAAVAAGADGLMVETHPHPESALSDGDQSLYFDQFAAMMRSLSPIAEAVGKSMPSATTDPGTVFANDKEAGAVPLGPPLA